MLAHPQLLGAVGRPVELVDDLDAADHLVEVLQRHAEHGLCDEPAVVKHRAVEARVGGGVLHDDRLPGFGDEAFEPDPILHRNIRNVRRTDMEDRRKTVRLPVKEPDRAGLAVQGFRDDLQTAGKRLIEILRLEKPLHDLPCRP